MLSLLRSHTPLLFATVDVDPGGQVPRKKWNRRNTNVNVFPHQRSCLLYAFVSIYYDIVISSKSEAYTVKLKAKGKGMVLDIAPLNDAQ